LIAWPQIGNAIAALKNFASRFVSQHHRNRPRAIPIDHGQIGMTKPRGFNPQQKFTWTRRFQSDFFNDQRS
jgi:hypothetical protein